MESITKSILIGKNSRISKCSLIPTDLDSIRATVLGKFYEGIIAKWLVEIKKYQFLEGKPSVYWQDLKIPNGSKYKDYKNSLENIKENKKIRTNSDGLFERNHHEYYLWEAKNWPKWNQGIPDEEQILKIFKTSPWIFAKKVKHKGTGKLIRGVIFSWWKNFDKSKDFEKEISRMIGSEFKMYFTSEIIDDCRENQYDWYLSLIKEQQWNMRDFFYQLKGIDKK
jgi:hypothetical protein